MGKKEDEFGLWEDYKKKGDKEAKKKLISSLTPLIRSQVGKYKNSGLPYKALELEGKKLTSHALDTYDPNKGTQINTHVTNHLQKLSRFTNSYQNIGHIPEPRALMLGRYETMFSNLEEEKGREPNIQELADALHVAPAEITRLQSERRADLHMELPAADLEDGGFTYYIMPDEEDPQLREAVEFVWFDSDPINKKIMEWTFGLGNMKKLKGKEIKAKLNLSETEFRKRRDEISRDIREIVG